MDQAPILAGGGGFDDDPPPEPREGWLLVRVHVPELNVFKCLQFPSDRLVWDVKQQVLASLPKELKESFNYGLFCPPSNGKAGKFLDEERRLGDYPFNGPVGYLELKYKRRVYKMLNLDEKQLKALHTRANLRRFLECIHGGHVEKIAKMCAKGLDPNFHCTESGDTPLTIATGAKKPNKLLIALVNGGALLDYRTKDGATALHKAVEHDCLEAVTTLLELGASPNYRDARGLTPLYLSVIKKTDTKICESLLHDHATLGTQDTQGWQEVHQACRHGLVHHLEHLLFYGAEMDSRNASGNTSLHVCAVNNQEACARMLLFRGADRAALNYANQTPYQVAVIAGNLELAEMIQNYKPEDIVPFRGPPRYNPRRRSGIGWGATTLRSGGPPSPCPSEHPFSSASSSLSEGSTSNRSHEDDISYVTDKSIGDTSDIISDSSGVGTNSDSAACSIGHPSTTVVCIETYSSTTMGHLSIQAGDVIEVVGSTDCGLLEGYVRGTNRSGFFPTEVVQEVNIRQKNITNVSTATVVEQQPAPNQTQQQPTLYQQSSIDSQQDAALSNGEQYRSSTAPRQKKVGICEPRNVVLHRAKRGFGFVLRGAKAASPLMQLKPSDRCPGLQYLDDVDPGGVADMAGLSPGDFLMAINGEDVRCASHEHVVDLIRSSGSLVTMTVVSPMFPNNFQQQQHYQQFGSAMNSRQCATLPRKMTIGNKLPKQNSMAPQPPRRDPKTTLSVGRARAKSMVAGLEGGSSSVEKDDDELQAAVKSSEAADLILKNFWKNADKIDNTSSAESIHQQSLSSASTPTQGGPGTPVQLRTASIKQRPTSSRITAAELVELFQRQTGETGENRYSTMMCSSHFQGTDSGAATPPPSPQKGPIVYASVADMKRKKNKVGTLRGKPCAIPTISDLKRTFHSTPDLASGLNQSTTAIWANANNFKGHRSQDDMYSLHSSMQRLNLHHQPPPNHPPPPPPTNNLVGQVVKVDVSRGSEYESTVALQKQLQAKAAAAAEETNEIRSSFKPATNAKLYACPQSLRNVGFRNNNETPPPANDQNSKTLVRKTTSLRTSIPNSVPSTISYASGAQQQRAANQYAQPIRAGTLPHPLHHRASLPQLSMPQIPDPDYSLSESDGEDENSVLVAHNTKMNEHIAVPAETSGNSNTSGSSSGSSSIPHSFSVDEIQKMRVKLKSSKSYPNDLLRQQSEQSNGQDENNDEQQCDQNQKQAKQPAGKTVLQKDKLSVGNHDECDNSSSGVSSDQEITVSNVKSIIKSTNASDAKNSNAKIITNATSLVNSVDNNNMKERPTSILKNSTANQMPAPMKIIDTVNKKSINLPPLSNVTKKISAVVADDTKNANNNAHEHADDSPPSPPAKGFQRHNSLTRKQAATIAMNRQIHTKSAVSLAQLPPPLEGDSDEPDHHSSTNTSQFYHAAECRKNTHNTKISLTATSMSARNALQVTRNNNTCTQQLLHSQQNRLCATVVANPSKPHSTVLSPPEEIVLAPPPGFADVCENAKCTATGGVNQFAPQKKDTGIPSATSSTNPAATRSVRIVGALPKISRLNSH